MIGPALSGSRVVVATNGAGSYVEQFNSTFGTVVFTSTRSRAAKLFLSQAAEVIRDINRFGFHRLYAELFNPADPFDRGSNASNPLG